MKLFVTLLAVIAVAGGAFWYFAAGNDEPAAGIAATGHQPQIRAVAKAGTRVPVMLMNKLASGDSKVGETGVFLVTEDIKDAAGHTVIPQGAIVTATVVQSRSAGAVSALLNEPARLVIEFGELRSSDATAKVETRSKKPGELQLTADNTGLPDLATDIGEVWDDPETRQGLQELARVVLEGRVPGAEAAKLMEHAAERLKLNSTADAIRGNNLDTLARVGDSLASGSLSVATGDVMATAAALQELLGLAGAVSSRLEGIFKGRNVRAYPGTEFEVFLAEDVVRTVQPR
ncbi:MAG: hypothetical protein HONBIEJF_01214 [Fimbriimonadaceae bacterium]|nr:hypothetical protein [Fimbriimonadaceae bacterium]